MPSRKALGTDSAGKQQPLPDYSTSIVDCDCPTCTEFWAEFDAVWQEYSSERNKIQRDKKCQLTSRIEDDSTDLEETEMVTTEEGTKLRRTDTDSRDIHRPHHMDSEGYGDRIRGAVKKRK